MWSTKQPATDASNPVAPHAIFHKQFLQNLGCMVAPLLILIKGKQATRMQKCHLLHVRGLTIVLALHVSNSICCVTQAFPVSN